MDDFPCPCRGENSSCFRCDGTGLVPAPVPRLPSPDFKEQARKQAQLLQASGTAKEPDIVSTQRTHSNVCRYCGARASASHWCKKPEAAMSEDLKRLVRAELKSARLAEATKAEAKAAANKPRPKPGQGKKSKARRQLHEQSQGPVTASGEDPRAAAKLDASLGRHIFRDGGLFGSYPAHDGMDDESFA